MNCVHQNEMVMLAGDMNGHGGSKVGYDGTHGGFGYGYGARNADRSKIFLFLSFYLSLVICNTVMKQESRLVTYAAGSVKLWLTILLYGRGTKLRFIISRVVRYCRFCLTFSSGTPIFSRC